MLLIGRKRYLMIVKDPQWIGGSAILVAEVVWLGSDDVADFDALHSRADDGRATACAFDLLMLNCGDIRKKPIAERKSCFAKCCAARVVAFNTSNTRRVTALQRVTYRF